MYSDKVMTKQNLAYLQQLQNNFWKRNSAAANQRWIPGLAAAYLKVWNIKITDARRLHAPVYIIQQARVLFSFF